MDLNAQGSASSSKRRLIRGDAAFSNGTGQTFHVPPTSGKYQPLRKLSPAQVEEAIVLYQLGMALQPIAKQMGVSRQAMHDLLKRRIELRPRLDAIPRKPKTAIRAKRNEALKRYRLRAARITTAQVNEVKERDVVCMRCGAEGTDVDHIAPVSQGGQTTMDNLQLLCLTCHQEKSRQDRRGVMPSEASPELICSAEASRSRAKTSVSRGSDAVLPGSGRDSSLSSPESQMNFSLDGSSSRTFPDSSLPPVDEISESFSRPWSTSGMAWVGGASMLDTSEWPSDAVECSLSDVLVANPDQRYALSARAAKGILRRAAARGRTLPASLHEALTVLASSGR